MKSNPNEVVVSVRLPKSIVRAIDGAISRGEARSRSDLVRGILGFHLTLAANMPGLEKGAGKMVKALGNPVLPIIEDALRRVWEELSPEKTKKLLDIWIDMVAPGIAAVEGVSADIIRRDLKRAIAEEPTFKSVLSEKAKHKRLKAEGRR
jgi:hypothetical protein